MSDRLMPHFSLKAFFFSLIVGFVTLGIIFLKSSSDLENLPSTRLELVLKTGQEAEIKLPNEKSFKAAQSGQEILPGVDLKTGKNQTLTLKKGGNILVLNQNTQIHILEVNSTPQVNYYSDQPWLKIELLTGEIGVKAEDLIVISTPKLNTNFVHSEGLLGYRQKNNLLQVLQGEVLLTLKKENQQNLTELSVPFDNQISFLDQQINEDFSSLKPSKLRKELKMSTLGEDFQSPPWFAAFMSEKRISENLSSYQVNSSFQYSIENFLQNLRSTLSFLPKSTQNIAQDKAELKWAYILGKLTRENDLNTTNDLLLRLKSDLQAYSDNFEKQIFLSQELSRVKESTLSTPAYLLKEFLIEELQASQGPILFRIYLADLQNALQNEDLQRAEAIGKKWQKKWSNDLILSHLEEYDHQAQLFHYTLLAHSDQVSLALLNYLDQATDALIKFEEDKEETRFDVAQQRLQITSTLINRYRYVLAKQYLKNSYLSLNIGASNPNLASTQVFITTGTLLAQRLEYALTSLHGSTKAIDEEEFQAYLQKKQLEQSRIDELKSILEVEEVSVENPVQNPTSLQVKERFKDAEIEVSEAMIKVKAEDPFSFEIQKASILKSPNQEVSFQGLYDFRTNTLSDVKLAGKDYEATFGLQDFVNFIKNPISLEVKNENPAKTLGASVDALLTDQEKIKAQEDQALARDVAIKFAVTQLSEAGLSISDLKSNIEISDPTHLELLYIKRANLPADEQAPETISFTYSTQTKLATEIRNSEGTLILTQAPLADLILKVEAKIQEKEKASQVTKDFLNFASKNQLLIAENQIQYTPEGYLELKDLELETLGLKVSGLYDPQTLKFISVTHPLLTLKNIDLKEYFKALVDFYLVDLLNQKQIQITSDQINATYPFSIIQLKNVKISQATFNFNLDINTLQPANIIHLNTGVSLGTMNFQQLKIYVAGLGTSNDSTPISPGSDPQ